MSYWPFICAENKVGFVQILKRLVHLSMYFLFQPTFIISHRLRKSVRHALPHRILRYVISVIISTNRGIKMQGKCKYYNLLAKLHTLPPCLTMFVIRVTLLSINYFKWRHYISAYNSFNWFKTWITNCNSNKNTVAIEASVRAIFMHIYHADMLPLIF